MHRLSAFRIAFVGLLPVLVSLWLSVLAFQPKPQVVRGAGTNTTACLGLCSEALAVDGVVIACKADLLGVSYSCSSRVLRPGTVEATFVKLPSLAGLLGIAPTQGTLVRLKRDGETVYSSSVHHHVWAALYGGWVFHAVYWPIVGFVAWRWPQSALASKLRRRHQGEA